MPHINQSKITAMEKTIVKQNKKIKGFVFKNNNGWWYVFGKPTQSSYISFSCEDKKTGIEAINAKSI